MLTPSDDAPRGCAKLCALAELLRLHICIMLTVRVPADYDAMHLLVWCAAKKRVLMDLPPAGRLC